MANEYQPAESATPLLGIARQRDAMIRRVWTWEAEGKAPAEHPLTLEIIQKRADIAEACPTNLIDALVMLSQAVAAAETLSEIPVQDLQQDSLTYYAAEIQSTLVGVRQFLESHAGVTADDLGIGFLGQVELH